MTNRDANEPEKPEPTVEGWYPRIVFENGEYALVDLAGSQEQGRVERRRSPEPRRSSGVKLVLIAGATPAQYPISQSETVVGRSAAADICIDDPLVSRRHCKIMHHAFGWALVDLKSQNGTFVNGVRVGETELRHGDQVQIGAFSFYFSESGDVPTTGSLEIIQAAKTLEQWLTAPTLWGLTSAPPPEPAGRPSRFHAPPVALSRRLASLSASVLLLVLVGLLGLGLFAMSSEPPVEDDFQRIFQAELSAEARQQVDHLQRQAETEAQAGHFPLAIESYRKILVLDPTHQEALSEIARIEDHLREEAEMEERAREEERRKHEHVAGLVEQANASATAGDFDTSLALLNQARGADPESPLVVQKLAELHVTEGERHRRRGAFHQAHAAFQTALELDPENVDAAQGISRIHASESRAQQRQRQAEKTRQRVDALTELGLTQLKNQEFSEAHTSFSEVLALDPSNARAREFGQRAQDLLEERARPIYEEGVRLFQEGLLLESVARLQRALSIYPDHRATRAFLTDNAAFLREEAANRYKRAYIYEGLGRLKDALELYRQTLALLPDTSEEYHQKAAQKIEKLETTAPAKR
ncbi:MAG: FHA domain-containing protein [Vicinamibacteria bacterium]